MLITELAMPVVNGIELVQMARKAKRGLPAILMTASAKPAVREKIKTMGCFGYIEKPFLPDKFKQVLETLINQPNMT